MSREATVALIAAAAAVILGLIWYRLQRRRRLANISWMAQRTAQWWSDWLHQSDQVALESIAEFEASLTEQISKLLLAGMPAVIIKMSDEPDRSLRVALEQAGITAWLAPLPHRACTWTHPTYVQTSVPGATGILSRKYPDGWEQAGE